MSKINIAAGLLDNRPAPTGVSNCVFVPSTPGLLPAFQLNKICMEFMEHSRPEYEISHKSHKGVDTVLKPDDWMFYTSNGTVKIKKAHLRFVEWFFSNESLYKNLARPTEWGLCTSQNGKTLLVFVHDSLDISSRSFFICNTALRALWEYPTYIDKWLELVDAGIHPNVAWLFCWVNEHKREDGLYSMSSYASGHSPFDSISSFTSIEDLKNGVPHPDVLEVNNKLYKKWVRGVQNAWGDTNNRTNFFKKYRDPKSDRYTDYYTKSLVEMLKELT